MQRREFIKTGAFTSAIIAMPDISGFALDRKRVKKDLSIGIQVGAVSFYDEGVDKLLDILVEKAAINTIYIPVFAYNRGLAGRQVPGFGFPDHGVAEVDKNFVGGYYAKMHDKYYKNSIYKPEHARAPELGDFDVLAEVIPKAHKRDIKVIAFFADNFRKDLPRADKLCEVDMNGNITSKINLANPHYLEFMQALMQDCVESYDIDGILWRTERPGPMADLLNVHHYKPRINAPAGFDEYNLQNATKKGIDVERVRQGFQRLIRYTENAQNGIAPLDGYYIEFWRILFEFPELLQWQQLSVENIRNMYRSLYDFTKSLNPELEVGWALSFKGIYNPFYRARQDLRELSNYSDFLKIVMYNHVGGARVHRFVENMQNSIYGDMTQQECLDFISKIMGYTDMDINRIESAGLPSEILKSETLRAKKGVEGASTKIYPAVDIDIPPVSSGYREYTKSTTPQDVRDSVSAALDGGADGIILARKYSEMKLSTIEGTRWALD